MQMCGVLGSRRCLRDGGDASGREAGPGWKDSGVSGWEFRQLVESGRGSVFRPACLWRRFVAAELPAEVWRLRGEVMGQTKAVARAGFGDTCPVKSTSEH